MGSVSKVVRLSGPRCRTTNVMQTRATRMRTVTTGNPSLVTEIARDASDRLIKDPGHRESRSHSSPRSHRPGRELIPKVESPSVSKVRLRRAFQSSARFCACQRPQRPLPTHPHAKSIFVTGAPTSYGRGTTCFIILIGTSFGPGMLSVVVPPDDQTIRSSGLRGKRERKSQHAAAKLVQLSSDR